MKWDELYPPSEEDENSMANIILLHSRLLRLQNGIEEAFPKVNNPQSLPILTDSFHANHLVPRHCG
jgi:hypothetical protein